MRINRSIFREYDIRGIFDKELNETSVKHIGYHLGRTIGDNTLVAVGFDARTHSPTLRDWLASGLHAAGCTVLDMGMVATPVNYFANYRPLAHFTDDAEKIASKERLIDASIMITGSHNPPEYNGFKITVDRAPFFGEQIYALAERIENDTTPEIPDCPPDYTIDVKSAYIAYMREAFAHLEGMPISIVVDCGNGVAGTVLPQIFDRLRLDWKGLYCEPDGTFPNHHPDPSVEANLIDLKRTLEKEGDIGFAYDGDADRIAVLTRKHNIKGDRMALLYAMKIDNPIVIGEVKCSQTMYDELEKRGAKAIMYKTGHSNLKVKMKEVDADLACEVSGHIFFKHRYFGYDDAVYATLRMLELIRDGIDIDAEIDALPKVYTTEEIKIETTEEEKFPLVEQVKTLLRHPPEDFPTIVALNEVDGVRITFEEGWALVRASNTTPVLVTRFESADRDTAHYYERKVGALIAQAQQHLRGANDAQ